MLSLFPELLFLAPLSAVVIRVAAAFTFAYIASGRLNTPSIVRGFGIVEGVVAALLFLGLYTQAAAAFGFIFSLAYLCAPRLRIVPTSTTLLLAVLSISLLVTGPGPFTITLAGVVFPLSFDMPL